MSFSSKREEGEPKRRRGRRFLAFLVLLLLVGGAGVYLLQQVGVDVREVLGTARTSSEDVATTAAVKTAFALSSKVSAFDIDVTTREGVVRLNGVVPSETVRDLAIAIAEDTAGVDEVQSFLEVEAAARPDPEIEALKQRIADLEIRAELDGKLLRNPELQGSDIRVRVNERIVTLEGTVENPELKTGAEMVARSVDNVVEVVNDITVSDTTAAEAQPAVAMDQEALEKRIRFELFATEAFNLDQMEIHTIDGVVTLAGMVRSQAEKLLAERIVRDIEGVDDVVNELDVLLVPSRASTTDLTKRALWRVAIEIGIL